MNESEDFTRNAYLPGVAISVSQIYGYLSDARIEDGEYLAEYIFGRICGDADEFLVLNTGNGVYQLITWTGKESWELWGAFNVFKYANGWKCQALGCNTFVKNGDLVKRACEHIRRVINGKLDTEK